MEFYTGLRQLLQLMFSNANNKVIESPADKLTLKVRIPELFTLVENKQFLKQKTLFAFLPEVR